MRLNLQLAALALVLPLSFATPAAEPIKLGAVVPLKDDAGRHNANAMRLAVKQINKAGGVLGRPLELIVVDDEMNTAKGAAAIEKLADEDKVDFFVGGMASSVHLAQIDALKKYGKVTVWSGATSSKVERALKDQDWYFHLFPWDYQQTQSCIEGWNAIAKKYMKGKSPRWFFAYEDGAFGTAAYKAHVEGFPATWTHKGADFKSAGVGGGGDYRVVLKRAKDDKPDVFVWIGYPADALPLMTQAREAGFAPPVMVGMNPGWPPEFARSPLSEGLSIYALWSPAMRNVSQASKRFSNAYEKEYHEEVGGWGPLGYSSVIILADAIKRAGTLETQAVIAALEKTQYASPLGETIAFKPSKVIKHQGLQRQKIMQWQKGVLQVVWPFEYATAPFRYPYKP